MSIRFISEVVVQLKILIAFIPYHALLYIASKLHTLALSLPQQPEYQSSAFSLLDISCGFMLWSDFWKTFGNFT